MILISDDLQQSSVAKQEVEGLPAVWREGLNVGIPPMRVPIQEMKTTGSWRLLTGSLGRATPCT